ncbi:MAG TPA: hypothetical protein VKM55_00965 [Candidatus Lokiarchaeia archaeon]|nr:hypothetical protein [Candidatus Lokiarchaeia archaeon]
MEKEIDLDFEVEVPIVLCRVSKIDYDESVQKSRTGKTDLKSFLKVHYFLAPFIWSPFGEKGEPEFMNSTWIPEGTSFYPDDCDVLNYEEIIGVYPIHGSVIMKPCDKCGSPVVIAIKIDGITSQLLKPDEPRDGICENTHKKDE